MRLPRKKDRNDALVRVTRLLADAEMTGATGVRVSDLRTAIGGPAAAAAPAAALHQDAERVAAAAPGADPLTGCLPVTADGK